VPLVPGRCRRATRSGSKGLDGAKEFGPARCRGLGAGHAVGTGTDANGARPSVTWAPTRAEELRRTGTDRIAAGEGPMPTWEAAGPSSATWSSPCGILAPKY